MSAALLVLPGDGIGPEIVGAAVSVLEAALPGLRFETAEIGFPALERAGSTIPDEVIERACAADGVLLGPVSHNAYPPVAEGGLNPSGVLRKRLDLYANIRPARSFDGLPSVGGNSVDLVIVRENTEGFYADRSMAQGSGEFMPTDDMALSIRKVTRQASERIAEWAFALAAGRRGRVTAVHKANVLRLSDGLFLQAVRDVAARHPGIALDEQLVDSMAALLVRDPGAFDVIVTTNMFGDILSDLATEVAGGIGMAASLNAGKTHGVAQAQHGSAPDLAGKDAANPSSMIGSAAMLLDWLGKRRGDGAMREAAGRIDSALADAVSRAETRTADLGGSLGTRAFTQAVLERLR